MAKKDPLDELNERAAAARQGMGLGKQSKAQEEDLDSLDVEDDELEDSDEEEEEESDEDTEEESKSTPSSEDEEDDSEDDEEEDDEEEESSERQPRKRGVPTSEFNRVRGEKRELEGNLKSLLEMVGADSVEAAKSKLQSLKTAPGVPSEAFVAAAKEMGVEDPENLTKLYSVIAPEIEKNIQEGKVKPLQESLQKLTSEVEPILHDAKIKAEWESFTPTIESTFPNATHKQVKQAERLMKSLVETEEFTAKEMDFVLFKKIGDFEEIFGARKRKGMVSSKPLPSSREKREEGVLPDIERGNHESIMDAKKKMKAIASQEDYRDGSEEQI